MTPLCHKEETKSKGRNLPLISQLNILKAKAIDFYLQSFKDNERRLNNTQEAFNRGNQGHTSSSQKTSPWWLFHGLGHGSQTIGFLFRVFFFMVRLRDDTCVLIIDTPRTEPVVAPAAYMLDTGLIKSTAVPLASGSVDVLFNSARRWHC